MKQKEAKSDGIAYTNIPIPVPYVVPADITETLFNIIKSTLESGEDVLVSGFVKFQVKSKKARRQETGELIIKLLFFYTVYTPDAMDRKRSWRGFSCLPRVYTSIYTNFNSL